MTDVEQLRKEFDKQPFWDYTGMKARSSEINLDKVFDWFLSKFNSREERVREEDK